MSDDGLDPVARLGDAPPFDASTDARVRAKVLGLLAEDGVEPPEGFVDDAVVAVAGADTPARRRAGARWGLRAGLAAGVAAVLALFVLLVVQPGGDGVPSLAEFADATGNAPHTTIGEGEVLVVATEVVQPGLWEQRSTKRIRPDGTGTEQTWFLPDGVESLNTYDEPLLTVGGMPYPMLVALPSEPDALYEAVLGYTGDEGSVPRALLELATTTATDPAVRASAIGLLTDWNATVVEDDGTTSITFTDGIGNEVTGDIDLDRGLVTRISLDGPVGNQYTRYLSTTAEPA